MKCRLFYDNEKRHFMKKIIASFVHNRVAI